MNKKVLFLCLILALFGVLFLSSCGCACKDDKVTVSFMTYTGVEIPSQELEKDSLVEEPKIALDRDGYIFKGWYNGQNKWSFDSSTVSEDTVLTAKWESYLSYIDNQDDTVSVVGCSFEIENVKIPSIFNGKKVTGIQRHAFADRKKIKSITIPSSITFIGDQAFSGCRALTSIVIPISVTKVGKEAFNFCDSLKEIHCEAQRMPAGWDYDFNKTNAQVNWNYRK